MRSIPKPAAVFLRAVLATACAAPLAAACSDDDKEKTPAQLAAEDASQALCERLFSCCSPSELDALPFVVERPPPTKDGCVAYHTKVALDFVALTEAEAAAGRVAIHVDRSEACVAAVREESCSDFHARLRRLHVGDAFKLCNPEVVEPLVADGAPCRLFLDCKGGYCELPPGTNTGADAGPEVKGTCKPLPTEGKPCVADGCAKGLRCDPDTGNCAKIVDTGEACASDDACASGACRGGKCVSPGRCGG